MFAAEVGPPQLALMGVAAIPLLVAVWTKLRDRLTDQRPRAMRPPSGR